MLGLRLSRSGAVGSPEVYEDPSLVYTMRGQPGLHAVLVGVSEYPLCAMRRALVGAIEVVACSWG